MHTAFGEKQRSATARPYPWGPRPTQRDAFIRSLNSAMTVACDVVLTGGDPGG